MKLKSLLAGIAISAMTVVGLSSQTEAQPWRHHHHHSYCYYHHCGGWGWRHHHNHYWNHGWRHHHHGHW